VNQRRRKSDKEITDVRLAANVSNAVEISRILLRSAEVKSNFDPEQPPQELAPGQQFGTSYALSESGALQVLATFALQLKPKAGADDSDTVALSVNAVYEVMYQLKDGSSFEPRELEHFAKLNGVLNLWPYWRELVHTVAARVGIGTITLPVYRVRAKVIETVKED
jgi:preprotein translocase subunit SecB